MDASSETHKNLRSLKTATTEGHHGFSRSPRAVEMGDCGSIPVVVEKRQLGCRTPEQLQIMCAAREHLGWVGGICTAIPG